MKQVWTVRVINPHEETRPTTRLPGLWVEQLRHLGVLNLLKETDEHQVLEFEAPFNTRGIDTQHWAEQEAARMRSFGINAAAAPKWGRL